jgi:hypothetical protein
MKLALASLLFFATSHADVGNTFYSQIQETFWSGSFNVTVKSEKTGKILKTLPNYPIDISFMPFENGQNQIGYKFRKDISKASPFAKLGFKKIDAVPCIVVGQPEPRMIAIKSSAGENAYAGSINYNNCRKGKVAEQLPIQNIGFVNGSDQKLGILVVATKGPVTLEIKYSLNRVAPFDITQPMAPR